MRIGFSLGLLVVSAVAAVGAVRELSVGSDGECLTLAVVSVLLIASAGAAAAHNTRARD